MGSGGDVLTRIRPTHMALGAQLWNSAMAAVCARRGHHWRLMGKAVEPGWNLPFGKREYCSRCEATRVTFKADGEERIFSKAELLAADPKLAESLYEARWGQPPWHRLGRGEWPVP